MLCTYLWVRDLPLPRCLEIFELADELMSERTYAVSPLKVLEVAARTGCSGYDSEFICLAEELNTHLVTFDSQLIAKSSPISCTPSDFKRSL